MSEGAWISGIGNTEYSRDSGRSEWELAIEAILSAIADAGLDPQQIDGLVRYSYDDVDEAMITRVLGTTLRFHAQVSYGGLGSAAALAAAEAAVRSGAAEAVICYRSLNGRSGKRYGRAERSLGTETQSVARGDRAPSGAFAGPYGLLAPGQVMALWATRYMYEAGISETDLILALGTLAVQQRAYARNNPDALMRDRELDLDTYRDSRLIAWPLRLFDFTLETDGAAAVVVTTRQLARRSPKPAVRILAAAMNLPPFAESVTVYGDLRNSGAYREAADHLYAKAGVSPRDLSVALVYDATTISALLTYEAFGLAPQNHGWKQIIDEGVGPNSRVPVNTHGGHLSEGYVHGMNHVLEAVRQMRGESSNQVPDANVALFAVGANGAILTSEVP